MDDSGPRISDQGVGVAVDSSGTWVAVWESYVYFSEVEGACEIAVSRSMDTGRTWSVPLRMRLGSDFNVHPAIVSTSPGRFIIVYERGGSATVMSIFSDDGGATWSSPSLVGFGTQPHVAAAPLGTVIVTFPSADQATIAVVRSVNFGASWSAPQILPFSDVGLSRIAYAGGTWLIAAGTFDSGCQISVVRSTDDGLTWTPVASIGDTCEFDDSAPGLACSESGAWMALWTRSRGVTDTQIAYARSEDDGITWTAVAALQTDTSGIQFGSIPAVLFFPPGNWLAAWSAVRPGSRDLDAFVSWSGDDAGTWSHPAPLNDYWVTDDSIVDCNPTLARDNAGRILAAWSSTIHGSSSEYDIMAAQFAIFDCANPPVCDCPGDVDGDGRVGLSDLGAMLAEFGCVGLCDADENDDGRVDLIDLSAVLAHWLQEC